MFYPTILLHFNILISHYKVFSCFKKSVVTDNPLLLHIDKVFYIFLLVLYNICELLMICEINL